MFDSTTAVYAALTKQTYLGSHSDAALVLIAGALVNMGRSGKKPIELPGPFWGAAEKAKQGPKVSAEVKQELSEKLRKYSSIPD